MLVASRGDAPRWPRKDLRSLVARHGPARDPIRQVQQVNPWRADEQEQSVIEKALGPIFVPRTEEQEQERPHDQRKRAHEAQDGPEPCHEDRLPAQRDPNHARSTWLLIKDEEALPWDEREGVEVLELG